MDKRLRNALISLTTLISVYTVCTYRVESHIRTPLNDDTMAAIDWAPHVKNDGPVLCPLPKNVDVFLVMGQSQAANMAERKMSAHMPASYMFNNSSCHQLRDPVLGATNSDGSIWPAFSDNMGGQVVIANMAISGSSIKEWTTRAQMDKVKKMAFELESAGYHNFKVIWVQGEADDMIKMPARDYHAHLNKLAAILPGKQWIMTLQSHCGWQGGGHNAINVAKRHFVMDDRKNRFIGPNLDELGAAFRKYNDCHFNVRGQSILAERMSDSVMASMDMNVIRWPLNHGHQAGRLLRK